MPANRYYTVTQEREVKISATNVLEAAKIAHAVFSGEVSKSEIPSAGILTEVRDRDLVVREDY